MTSEVGGPVGPLAHPALERFLRTASRRPCTVVVLPVDEVLDSGDGRNSERHEEPRHGRILRRPFHRGRSPTGPMRYHPTPVVTARVAPSRNPRRTGTYRSIFRLLQLVHAGTTGDAAK